MNKKFRFAFYFFSISFLLFHSCSESSEIDTDSGIDDTVDDEVTIDNPEEEIYFTLNIGDAAFSEGSESWIVLHDEKGQLLDFALYDSGDVLTFSKRNDSIPSSLNITFFSSSTQPNPNSTIINYGITTLSEVKINSEWEIFSSNNTNSSNESRETVGSFSFTLNGVPAPFNLSQNKFSSKYGNINNSFTIEDDNSGVLAFVYDFVSIQDEADDFIYSRIDNEGNLKYYFLENVQNDANLEVNLADFNLYDEYINVPFGNSTFYEASIEAYEDNQDFSPIGGFSGYQLLSVNSALSQLSNPFVSPGYLDRFTKYRSEIKLNGEKYLYHFLKYGEKPESIGAPMSTMFNVTDNSINTFEFESSIPFVRKRVNFFKTVNQNNTTFVTSWNFISDKSKNPGIVGLPTEITDRYENIDLDALEYNYTELFFNFSKTYQELIDVYEDNDNENPIESFEKIQFFP